MEGSNCETYSIHFLPSNKHKETFDLQLIAYHYSVDIVEKV